MYHEFVDFAEALEDKESAHLIFEDEDQDGDVIIGVICPFCKEKIFFKDWDGLDRDTKQWTVCPFCYFDDDDFFLFDEDFS